VVQLPDADLGIERSADRRQRRVQELLVICAGVVLRRPGQKEERYEQLLQGGEEQAAASAETAPRQAEQAGPNDGYTGVGAAPPAPGAHERSQLQDAQLQELRARIERLERELAELRLAIRR
jgi:uncharacterized protein YceH (UPF0502 family)